jgi:hypothetical protein
MVNEMSNWNKYKNKTYTQQEARKMDYELDILHDLVSSLYNKDVNAEEIKLTLDRIERVIQSKPDMRETG